MIKNPIFIFGCARSGTSLVAGIVYRCGAWGGPEADMIRPSQVNKKGFYENRVIRNQVAKKYLGMIGADPMAQNPLPEKDQLIPYDLKSEMHRIIKAQGYVSGAWFYKCVKFLHFWEIVLENFPNAYYITVHRSSRAIGMSCLNTPFMRKIRTLEGWMKWAKVHEERLTELEEANPDKTFSVQSEEIIKGNLDTIKSVIEQVGLEWNEEEVRNFIEPKLYHFRQPHEENELCQELSTTMSPQLLTQT